MIYSDYKGEKISMLGFGAMRLPVTDGDDGKVDTEATQKIVDAAYGAGINYFDTAWGYHMGTSETVMGNALKKYPRDSFYLSTKFPGYDLSNFGKHEEIFEKQLEKCQTDHFDFYFIHNVCELNIEKYLDEERYHTVSYFAEQKKKGRIKHLGFSAHGSPEVMRRFLDKYGDYMEFGMIQLNYLDYEFQHAKEKAEILRSRGLPIWVMEPLRGGMLAAMTSDDVKKLQEFRPGSTPVQWAFWFLQSIPGVTVILSGMNDPEMMREKIDIFAEKRPLGENEMSALLEIAKGMVNGKIVPCTACKYCLSHCPKKLNIPDLLAKYNENQFTGGGFIAPFAIRSLPPEKRPTACIGCRSCEKVCPQQIKISEVMKKFGADMDIAMAAMFGNPE